MPLESGELVSAAVGQSQKQALGAFHPCARKWFEESFVKATKAQVLAWEPIRRGESTLLLAPTGSGKTLAAFFAALERLLFSPPVESPGVRVLYISPLKALGVDVERNLRAPLVGLANAAAAADIEAQPVRVGVRSGDTPPAERERMRRKPPEILITTPESLYLLLTSKSREMFRNLETVIIDEIHTMVAGKRGSHLFLSLERLEQLRREQAPKIKPVQRIGLSATQRPQSEVARLLGGFEVSGDSVQQRPVAVIDAGEKKKLDLKVEVPTADMKQFSDAADWPLNEPGAPGSAGAGIAHDGQAHSIWPAIYPRLVELIRSHRSTIVFVNSRGGAERMAATINELAEEPLARALKAGQLPAIVATASLELGIDMGAVDLVVQVESPPSISSGMQRIGRAQHHVGGVPEGVTFPKFRSDLIACAASTRAMLEGRIEASYYPRNPLDVLAQQIVAMLSIEPLMLDELFDIVRRAAPFAELSRGSFESVLDMLSGRYPSDDFSDLKPRITWDRISGELSARQGAGRIAIINGGTIPERGLYGVFLASGSGESSRRVGELDEEMVFESRVGDVFLLGASSWRVEEITHDRVLVTPAPGEPGRMPFWHGDRPGRPLEFGREIGSFIRIISQLPEAQALERLQSKHCLDELAAKNLLDYLDEQKEQSALVSDRQIVVERFTDEIGDRRICILTPFGAQVHAPWAMAIRGELVESLGLDVDVTWSDDGIVFRLTEGEREPSLSTFIPQEEEVEASLINRLGETSLFAARFRENAGRALLLTKKRPGGRTPLWALRRRSATLLGIAARYRDFPIVLETYRECLKDYFDVPGLREVLREINTRKIRIVEREADGPSPFAATVLFSFVSQFMYQDDAPLAERRAQALTIDPARLSELLGVEALRKLLDLEVIEQVEDQLQKRQLPLRHADDLHDLLLSLGPMTEAELLQRGAENVDLIECIQELLGACRVIRVRRGKDPQLAAVEDAARLRDGLGLEPPSGLPQVFLERSETALADLLLRHARTHGPFRLKQIADRFSQGQEKVQACLEQLTAEGRLIYGHFLPGGQEKEWVEPQVLRRIKRLSLLKLRGQVQAVPQAALQRFSLDWHQLTGVPVASFSEFTADSTASSKPKSGSVDQLLDLVESLEGAPLPADTLESEILGERMRYSGADLDQLCSSGEVIWQGVRGSRADSGRIALYLTEHFSALARRQQPLDGATFDEIRGVLKGRGGVFFRDLCAELEGFKPELFERLWELVWNGEVSNDTLTPLRRLLAGSSSKNKARGKKPRPGSRRSRHPAAALAGSEGRFWLTSDRLQESADSTERRMVWTEQLLMRHGVLTRESLGPEELEGGFSAVYPVLKLMEERGKVRRGYFVEGLGATQFASPGAEDRLRDLKEPAAEPEVLHLAATDPANLYGSVLPWPKGLSGRAERAPGARVTLLEGELIGFLSRSQKNLITHLSEDLAERQRQERAIALALVDLLRKEERRSFLLEEVNGSPAQQSELTAVLQQVGFTSGHAGLMWRGEGRAALGQRRKRPEP